MAGSFSAGSGSAACTLCPVTSYGPVALATICIPCPNNRITSFAGATNVDFCVSIATNYAIAFFAFAFSLVFYYVYLYRERIFLVSRLRKKRITDNILQGAQQVFQAVTAAHADEAVSTTVMSRRFRATCFMVGSLVCVFTVAMVGVMFTFYETFFSVIILWRSYNILPVLKEGVGVMIRKIGIWFSIVGRMLGMPRLVELFSTPFIAIAEFISTIDIDELLASVNVTCKGSLAPLQLLANFLIFGTTFLIIESEFSFLSLARAKLVPAYLARVLEKEQGWLAKIKLVLCKKGPLLSVMSMFPMQATLSALLRFMMTLVSVSVFFPGHDYTEACSSLEPKNMDAFYAAVSSMVAWMCIYPAIYVIARICLPSSRNSSDPPNGKWVSSLFQWAGGVSYQVAVPYDWAPLRDAENSAPVIHFQPDVWLGQLEHLTVYLLKKGLDSSLTLGGANPAAIGFWYSEETDPSNRDSATEPDLPPFCIAVDKCIEKLTSKPKEELERWVYYALWPLTAFGPLQLYTPYGRYLLLHVLDKYVAFVEVSLGIWNDATVEAFGLHDKVKTYCLNNGVNTEDHTLANDYSDVLTAAFSTRAVLFQLVGLTFLTVFINLCGSAPLFVFVTQLDKNYPMLHLSAPRDRSPARTNPHPFLWWCRLISNATLTRGYKFCYGLASYVITILLYIETGKFNTGNSSSEQVRTLLLASLIMSMVNYILASLGTVSDFGNAIQLQQGDFGALFCWKVKTLERPVLGRTTTTLRPNQEDNIELEGITPRGTWFGHNRDGDQQHKYWFRPTDSPGKYERLSRSDDDDALNVQSGESTATAAAAAAAAAANAAAVAAAAAAAAVAAATAPPRPPSPNLTNCGISSIPVNKWSCGRCTTFNTRKAKQCKVCDTPRHQTAGPALPPHL